MQVPSAQEAGSRRITVAEYYRMAEEGAFDEHKRVELLEGEVHVMSPQGMWHTRVINRLTMLLVPAVLGKGLTVQVQGPLTLSEFSEPEPDLSVFRTEDEEASDEHHPSTALLSIEVAESSLSKDRGIKVRLYARARISEYWIVNLRQQTVEVYTGPQPDRGRYATMRTYARGEVIQCTSVPQIQMEVEALFR